jgi:hypothetical protein
VLLRLVVRRQTGGIGITDILVIAGMTAQPKLRR